MRVVGTGIPIIYKKVGPFLGGNKVLEDSITVPKNSYFSDNALS